VRPIFIDGDRFTNDPWYCQLSPVAAHLYDFMESNCDRAGFYVWNIQQVSTLLKYNMAQLNEALPEMLRTRDPENGQRVYMEGSVIYLHHRLNVSDPNGLMVTSNAHIGIIKKLIRKAPDFPECMKHLPGTFAEVSKEARERMAGLLKAKKKPKALQSLINTIEAALRSPQDPQELQGMQQSLAFEETVPKEVITCMQLLKRQPGYHFNQEVDRRFLLDLMVEFKFSEGDLTEVAKDVIASWIDEPIVKGSRPHSKIRNWCRARCNRKKRDEVGRSTWKEPSPGTTARIDQEKKEEEQIAKEREWMSKHCEEKDIETVTKKFKCSRGVAIWFMNQARRRLKLEPLEGAKDPTE